jgi:hypothetical protein
VGIQYSIATAMLLHGLKKEADDLLMATYRNLYVEAKIPFAAPEGFNGSCRLHPEMLAKEFGIAGSKANALHKDLLAAKALLPDWRIDPSLSRDLGAFTRKFKALATKHKVDASKLFALLHGTALKYTAGKYFRPGMVFAVCKAMG